MRKLILSLILSLYTLSAFAAFLTPVLDPSASPNNVKYTISITGDTTGRQCVNMQGYKYWYFATDISGTIQYDLESSLTAIPTGHEQDDLAASATNLTADSTFKDINVAPYFCVQIDSCTTCTLTTTIWGGR